MRPRCWSVRWSLSTGLTRSTGGRMSISRAVCATISSRSGTSEAGRVCAPPLVPSPAVPAPGIRSVTEVSAQEVDCEDVGQLRRSRVADHPRPVRSTGDRVETHEVREHLQTCRLMRSESARPPRMHVSSLPHRPVAARDRLRRSVPIEATVHREVGVTSPRRSVQP